jgi:hypothetical protein
MSNPPDEPNAPSIGVIWMEADGSIVVRLRADDGVRIAEVNRMFSPHHLKYQQVIAHVGGLAAGEAKRLCEWDFRLFEIERRAGLFEWLRRRPGARVDR